MIRSEQSLARLALTLGAAEAGGPLSAGERELARAAAELPPAPGPPAAGAPAATRRAAGAVYTPGQLVGPMVDWVQEQSPSRVVDAGAGSGRFIGEIIR